MTMIKLLSLSAIVATFTLAPLPAFAAEDGIHAQSKAPITIARNKPRVPGGSGCDDPRDLIEHPECRALKPGDIGTFTIARNKPRVPGGSGCDDPRDLIEHPECRALKPADIGTFTIARNKPRVPGGSGCDDPRDLREHPECRV
jgi:hypothetical protein